LVRVEDGKWTDLDTDFSFAHSVEFSPDGTLLATGLSDGVARLWDTATGKLVRALPGHPGYVLALAFSADGRTLAVGSWRSVRLWEVAGVKGASPAGGRPRGRVTEVEGDGFGAAVSPDGRGLACGCGDSAILLWDVAGRQGGEPGRPGAADLGRERLWQDLSGADGEKAYRALWALAAAPDDALPRLRAALKPTAPPDAKLVERLLRD